MKKIFFVAFAFALSLSTVLAQETFEFNNTLADTARSGFKYSMASEHYLGDIIAKKWFRFKETYTYVEKGTPMSPGDKVIVRKPTVFYAVRKLNNYYKKEIRKGRINPSDAIDEFGSILDKSFVIYDQKTDEFEELLKSSGKPKDIIKAFEKVELI